MNTEETQTQLYDLVAEFRVTGDGQELFEFIHAHPELQETCIGEYPFVHRVQDLNLGGTIFQLIRSVFPSERLGISSTESDCDLAGVPLELTGRRLQAWARFESIRPQKDLVDWDEWLNLDLSTNQLRLLFSLENDGIIGELFCGHEKWIELRLDKDKFTAKFLTLNEVELKQVDCDILVDLLNKARRKLQLGS